MIISEALKTEVKYTPDVLVCGGGVAGIAAALAAARSGKRVILTERCFMLGGLATAGLVTIYLPLCDGMGRQVSYGLAEELLKLSVEHWHNEKRGYPDWLGERCGQPKTERDDRYEVDFNPQLFAISAEQLLLREGVEILYGTTAVAASVKNGGIEAVICENKSGRFAIGAQGYVDATGDADLAVFAGVPTVNFSQGNLLAGWYYYNGETGYDLRQLGAADIPDSQKNGQNTVEQLTPTRFGGIDGKEISDMVTLAHAKLLEDLSRRRQKQPDLMPLTMATIPQLRMTRRVDGEYTLHDTEQHIYFEDSIGMVSDWRRRGPVYEVPFRTLYSRAVKNLAFAGRVTSVTDDMWDIMRVIPCCAVTGEAAGVAVSMFDDLSAADVTALQAELARRGVVLHE